MGDHGDRRTARVKTYGDVILEYEYHAESKCADSNGNPSDQQTIGPLQRRHVRMGHITLIGKESNSLEEVEAGLIHLAGDVYTVYRPLAEWRNEIVPGMKTIPLSKLIAKKRACRAEC